MERQREAARDLVAYESMDTAWNWDSQEGRMYGTFLAETSCVGTELWPLRRATLAFVPSSSSILRTNSEFKSPVD